jgi:serine/threonine protein phosphatase PrpC
MARDWSRLSRSRSSRIARKRSNLLLNVFLCRLSLSQWHASSALSDDTMLFRRQGEAATPTDPSSELLLPRDILMDSTTRMALAALRHYPHESALYLDQLSALQFSQKYSTANQQCTLTMVGYKGGSHLEQTNQDRSIVLIHPDYVLSGVFDGHGEVGHFVAEWSRHVLVDKVQQGLASLVPEKEDQALTQNKILQLLKDAFVQTDANLPQHLAINGGTTASVVLQWQKSTLFLANAGDSQSFVVAAVVVNDNNNNYNVVNTRVVYQTRLDKPDDPDEYQRLVAAGATVEMATDEDDARIWYTSILDELSGLAMSRSLGDRGADSVIAEPTVKVLNVTLLKEQVLERYYSMAMSSLSFNETCKADSLFPLHVSERSDNDTLRTTTGMCQATNGSAQVYFFVVSATDGVIDVLTPQAVATELAKALHGGDHSLLLATEDVLLRAASHWNIPGPGAYRDDITMAVSQIAVPR